MLEAGRTVLDCKIVEQLSSNDIYQGYLVNCSDSTTAKLLVFFPDPLFDQKQQQAFLDQVEKLASQTFSGIGTPLRARDIDGYPACLFPFPPGISLQQTINAEISVRQAIDLIKKIAVCLSAPHRAGLWHGNLSPETICLENETPFLADFSLTQLLRLDYNSGVDPQYTSPEQIRGEMLGIATDSYNLGCIFYRLLAGRVPFTGDDAFSIAKQHLQGEFPQLPAELSLLQPLLASLVETTIEKRSTVDELIIQIEQLSDHQELELLKLSVPVDDSLSDGLPLKEDGSLLNEAMSPSEMSARIEARLKEHVSNFQETEPVEIPTVEEDDVNAELDQVSRKEKPRFWRFVLVLFLGVLIGSGLYFLFYSQSSSVAPAVIVQNVQTENHLIADLDQGLQLWQQADFNGAERKFEQVIVEYPEDPRAYNNLAAFYAAQGNYDQARDHLEQALATDEAYSTVYRNLGAIYTEMARGSYGRALQLDKSQAQISLPVFSSEGLVNLNPMAAAAVAVQEQNFTETATKSQLSQVGQQIAAAKAVPAEGSRNVPLVAVEPIKVDEEIQLGTDERPVVAVELSQSGESQSADTVLAAIKQESEEDFLRRWAQAWSNQNVDEYLTFYGEAFTPPAGRNRTDWETQRRTRIMSPKE
ncbi:MAG: tetratricopeptide repeat protein, partial [Desulfuromusa sp.]|nr:tetratricopeptide repeat protein [Desulfuromusa sp.]